jgi:outer membrane putative beta-barrel porin/alpha-amylase
MFDETGVSITKISPRLGGASPLESAPERAPRPFALAAALAAALVSAPAHAQPAGAPDGNEATVARDRARAGGGYHLFKPTPRDQLRELSPDRPDTTESPVTVDAGHFQFELEAGSVGRDQGATELTTGVLNAKAGLTPGADLQVVFDGLHHVDGSDALGDITLRVKLNFWGNDAGASAFGLIPFVTFPGGAAGVDAVEAGLIFPLQLRLPDEWSFGTMLEVDAVDRSDGYGIDTLVSATMEHALWGDLEGYAEVEATVAVDEAEPAEVAANAGLVLGVTDDISIDSGVRVGLTEAADDLVAFVGGTARY